MKLDLTQSFDHENAYKLALAAQLAYQSQQEIEKSLSEIGITRYKFISVGDSQCYIAETNDYYLVVFRGTESDIGDWLTDLNFDFSRHRFGLVHDGFYRSLKELYPGIEKNLKQYKSKPVFISGHSLGAALAALCAIALKFSGFTIAGVYTYGMPRVGNHLFASNYDAQLKQVTFRLVNNNDIVTRMPPRIMSYQHVGTLQYITESGEITAKSSFWRIFLDRLHGRAGDILQWGTDGLKDHFIDAYREKLTFK